jgi:hypothetical protein
MRRGGFRAQNYMFLSYNCNLCAISHGSQVPLLSDHGGTVPTCEPQVITKIGLIVLKVGS